MKMYLIISSSHDPEGKVVFRITANDDENEAKEQANYYVQECDEDYAWVVEAPIVYTADRLKLQPQYVRYS